MSKRSLLVVVFVAILTSGLFAQATKLKKARNYMDDLNYVGAIELYNQILDNSDNADAKINIAECYRKISDSENAEFWYGQVVRLPEAEAVHYLFYGQALQRNGKCELAKEWYEKYIAAVPDDIRGQYLVRACDYEEELMIKNGSIYEITHLDFNSNLDDFSPAYHKDGIIFSSERDRGSAVKRMHSWTGNPFLDLYYVDRKEDSAGEMEGVCGNYVYGRPEKWSQSTNTKFHDAVVTFNSDETMVLYTRNNLEGKSDDGTIKLKVFSADVNGNEVTNFEGLPFNSDEYSVAHPSLTPDNSRLYFASDMPGGFGGMDLYYSDYNGGSWGPPMNLGPQINTEGQEIFPYYSKDGRLYFSSNGHIGLGGLDIYFMQDLGNGEFGAMDNMAYPINTISDDFGIIFNDEGTCGYFSSDRTGGAGRDDIYSFKKTAVPVEVYVFDEQTKLPIEGASVVDDCTGATLTTGANGKAVIDMKINECCTFAATAEMYMDNEKQGCTTSDLSERLIVEIPMKSAMAFDLAGVVYDGDSELPMSGATVTLTNDCDEEEQSFVTTESGRYSFDLKDDCCYTVTASYDGFDSVSQQKCTRGKTEGGTMTADLTLTKPSDAGVVTTLPSDTNPGQTGIYSKDGVYVDAATGQPYTGTYSGIEYKDGQPVGGSSGGFPVGPSTGQTADASVYYLLHVYYDFDQSYLRDEASVELNKLLTLMNNNPDYIVEIASHTDSRGSNSYNNRLSQRRADSVIRWLSEKGVDRERLVSRGYGEDVNVNNCVNEVPCSEKEHQLNRRTEFRILGCKGCVDNPIISQPKSDPLVDPCEGCPF